MKSFIINLFFYSFIFTQTNIQIYNHGYALIQEEQTKQFIKIGNNKLIINNFPKSTLPESIILLSNDMQIKTQEYINLSISINNLLNYNINKEIELIKYNENGDVTGVRNVSKSRTAWIRRGIAGGEFKDFSFNVKVFKV